MEQIMPLTAEELAVMPLEEKSRRALILAKRNGIVSYLNSIKNVQPTDDALIEAIDYLLRNPDRCNADTFSYIISEEM